MAGIYYSDPTSVVKHRSPGSRLGAQGSLGLSLDSRFPSPGLSLGVLSVGSHLGVVGSPGLCLGALRPGLCLGAVRSPGSHPGTTLYTTCHT